MSKNLLNALYNNDAKKAQEIFNDVMDVKQGEAIEVKKAAVAADIFNPRELGE
tara:strand:+ start:347 stop:505 length:159 start_codon:yes stop_codon:yes gene_type:complete